ncbi:phosphatase PAP2 family protein [Streptomyces zingiberis]|uniref:Phosphatase PAP2 family protein n=1 Tax=Streptomyces zingiberis TaxID=2053010 RepID=A0ABX1C069_9ACTN|nr:phosphatase PAP2 family protein [Streptomyces zingiberis]NJQ01342.1 phosphatase PAP2 family protein [Streptomyces zingiberis]
MRTDRILARLEQEPERASNRDVPRMSRTRKVLLASAVACYAAIVLAVLVSDRLVHLDWQVMLFRPYKQWPELHAALDYFVVLGQRGPTAVLVAAWLGWRSWRQRTLRPLLVLGAALLLLNSTVGSVKYGLGRLGPHYATTVGADEMFAGGDIFPSGHTANAVVTWGILAYLATTPRARRVLSLVAAGFALGVGATTVYLGTHWVSDVLLGWIAGLVVLLALPWCEPLIAAANDWLLDTRDRLKAGRRPAPLPFPIPPLPAVPERLPSTAVPDGTATAPAAREPAGPVPPREPVAAATGSRPGGTGYGGAPPRTYPAPRTHPHPGRSERSPAGPTGSRRPQPGADRAPRTAPVGPGGRYGHTAG